MYKYIGENEHYWLFENNNQYSKSIYTKQEAIEDANTLVNCSDCENCHNLTNCINCYSCSDSENLKGCDDCVSCENLVNCEECQNSKNLKNCVRCFNVVGSGEGTVIQGNHRSTGNVTQYDNVGGRPLVLNKTSHRGFKILLVIIAIIYVVVNALFAMI